jgi:hypothetical protein
MAIICNLFDDAVWSALAADPAGVSVGSSVVSAGDPAEAPAEILDPCVSCPLRGLCDDDYCGMQCFPLDMPECPNEAGWEAFGLD